MKLGKYEWDPETDLLGEGASAKVYKASNGKNGFVALKVADKASSNSDVGKDKYSLEEEFAKGRDLLHPHLVHYSDLEYIVHPNIMNQPAQYAVLIMEYADKGSLEDKFKKSEIPLNNTANIIKITREILNGLTYLHSQGIIHRDLKPANILFKTDKVGNEIVKLADFGISRDMLSKEQSSIATVVGTVPYMAPEQFYKKTYGLKGSLSSQTDIWAVGVILYRMLTGKLPFGNEAESYEEVRDEITEKDPDYSAVPGQYHAVIKGCLKKNAADRLADEAAVLFLLDKAGQIPPTPAADATVGGSSGPAADKPFDPNETIFQSPEEIRKEDPNKKQSAQFQSNGPPQRPGVVSPPEKKPGNNNYLGIAAFIVVVIVIAIFVWGPRSGNRDKQMQDSLISDSLKKDSILKADALAKIEASKFYFSDNFSDNSNNWPLYSDSDKEINVANHMLRIKGISDHYSYHATKTFSIDISKDFTVTVKTEWISGITNNGFGLNYCSNPLSNSYYIFYISTDGEYCIRYFEHNGDWKEIKTWTKSEYIKQNRQINVLSLKKEGANMSFYINDHLIQTLPFEGGFGSAFGFRVSSAQTVDFESFTLSGTKSGDNAMMADSTKKDTTGKK